MFVLGPGVDPAHQAAIDLGLDIAATYFRAELARDLPAVTAYIEDDVEGMVALYAQTYPRTVALSRQIWQGGTTASPPRGVRG